MRKLLLLILSAILLTGCRDDAEVILPENYGTGETAPTEYLGMYLLNEGNMGSNKATLDYLDLKTGIYLRNIYPSRNPNQVKELGDVGNDIKTYGSKLWMVINCSNKVEVADTKTTVSRGHIDIPNCRYLAFHDGYAYVSSYVGPVNGTSVLGEVYKVDTASLSVVAKCTVGYQPEEMAVMGGKLYVANSGGYSAMQGQGYDNTVDVIDLSTFQRIKRIAVAPNLHHIRKDRYGSLWVTSRGDYGNTPSRLYQLYNDEVAGMIDTPVSDFTLRGDSLIYYGYANNKASYGIIDLKSNSIVNSHFIKQPANNNIQIPYGIIADPYSGNVYIMDATNYVSSGKLYCFDKDGNYKWNTWTGDIPGHACFVSSKVSTAETEETPEKLSAYIAAVDEYVPAPGQFVNTLPLMDADDDADSARIKASKAIAGSLNGMITLGGYGGYVTFHFDHPVKNIAGQNDIYIKGNTFAGNSEPGIVMVSQDRNHNGLPDDEWFELKGSADEDSIGKVVYGYEITYTPAAMVDIPWKDNQGRTGLVARNNFHRQEYFPLWIHTPLTFTGTLLPANGHNHGTNGGQHWVMDAYRYGYVDNLATDEGCSFNIEWAVDNHRKSVKLSSIDFVRVYTAVNQTCGWLGEISTEVCGARDLHI